MRGAGTQVWAGGTGARGAQRFEELGRWLCHPARPGQGSCPWTCVCTCTAGSEPEGPGRGGSGGGRRSQQRALAEAAGFSHGDPGVPPPLCAGCGTGAASCSGCRPDKVETLGHHPVQ